MAKIQNFLLMEIKKNKNKNATQDFRDFSAGRERANKQFFFWPNHRSTRNKGIEQACYPVMQDHSEYCA